MGSSHAQLQQLLEELPAEQGDYLRRLLHNAPMWLFDEMHIISVDAGRTFIHEGETVDRIYILVSGSVRAVDYRIMNIEYHYTHFTPINMFGSMELLNHINVYKTTLIAETPCKMICMPAQALLRWMKLDCNALLMEAQAIITYLLDQARTDRIFLFTQGMERLIFLMIQEYEMHPESTSCTMNLSRREWSNRTGLSIKTVDRALQTMAEDGMLIKSRHEIQFDHSQYQKMRAYLSDKIARF